MNYFEHHIGDYDQATAHLSAVEDGIYCRLIRRYMATERPLPADIPGLQRLVRAHSRDEKKAVQTILAEFFELRDDGYHQHRCDEEIARFQEKSAKAKRSAEARWGQPRGESESHANADANASAKHDAPAMRTHSEGNAHHTPDTNHQSPDREKDTRTATGTEAGRVCRLLKRAGIADVQTGHPDLLALIAAGATDAEFESAARTAVERGKGFAYALGTLKRQRIEAAQAAQAMHRGPMATAAPPPGRRTAVDRQIATMNALTGKDRSHGPAPAADSANVVDVDARVVP